QVDRKVRTQIRGEARDQVAHEGVVQQMDRANLRFRDAVGPAEVEFDCGRFALAVLDVLKYSVDFLLRKLSAQPWAPRTEIGGMRGNFRETGPRNYAGCTLFLQLF